YGGHTLQHSSYRPASTSRSERPRLLSGPPRHVASAIRRQGNPLTPHRPRRSVISRSGKALPTIGHRPCRIESPAPRRAQSLPRVGSPSQSRELTSTVPYI